MSLRTKLASLLLAAVLAGCFGANPQARRAAEAHRRLAMHAMRSGALPQAIDQLEEAIALHDRFVEAYNDMGLVYLLMGEDDRAVDAFRRALELDPKYSDAMNNLGTVEQRRGNLEAAARLFTQAAQDIRYDHRSYAEGNLGWVRFKQGRMDDAIGHLRAAVERNPGFCLGLLQLGHVYHEQEQDQAARAQLERFMERCADDPEVGRQVPQALKSEARYRLGVILGKAGETREACATFAHCVTETEGGPFVAECRDAAATLGCPPIEKKKEENDG